MYFLSESDCTFSAERRKLVTFWEHERSQLSICFWRTVASRFPVWWQHLPDSEVRKRSASLRELFTVPGNSENCKWIPVWPCCVQLSASWRAILWGWAQLFASPLPSIYPQFRLLCTEIKTEENRLTCSTKTLHIKQREGVGKIKITLGFIETEEIVKETQIGKRVLQRGKDTKRLKDKGQNKKIKTREQARGSKVERWYRKK